MMIPTSGHIPVVIGIILFFVINANAGAGSTKSEIVYIYRIG